MSGQEALRRKLLRWAEEEAEPLDALVTMAGVAMPADAKALLCRRARQIGTDWAREFWNKEESAEHNLERLGIRALRWMSPMEEAAYFARALYDPASRCIQISRARLEEMEQAQQMVALSLFSREEIRLRLLAHECFHHLEEQSETRLSEILAPGRTLPDAFRDVGAHAFANEVCGRPPCQMIDLLWLAARDPSRLSEW